MPETSERWLSITEFSIIYGISVNSIREMIKKKILPAMKIGFITRIKDPGWGKQAEFETEFPGKRGPDEVFLLRPCEVAEILEVSPRWIRKMADKGQLEYFEVGHRQRRYSVAAIRKLLDAKAGGKSRRRGGNTRSTIVRLARSRLGLSPMPSPHKMLKDMFKKIDS